MKIASMQFFSLISLWGQRQEGKKAYKKFMAMEDSQEIQEVFERKKIPSMLGGEDFITWVKENFFASKKHRQVPEAFQLALERAMIIKEVCRTYGVSEEEIL